MPEIEEDFFGERMKWDIRQSPITEAKIKQPVQPDLFSFANETKDAKGQSNDLIDFSENLVSFESHTPLPHANSFTPTQNLMDLMSP